MKTTIILGRTGIVLRNISFTEIQLAAFFFIMRTRVTKAPLSFTEQIHVLTAALIAAGFTVVILWKKENPYSALIATSEVVGSITVFRKPVWQLSGAFGWPSAKRPVSCSTASRRR